MQFIIGACFIWLGWHLPQMLKQADTAFLTFFFLFLVMACATQDIAVDGWALELLSKENIQFASTAQTVGLNCGYFLSFTVFLALNSVDFRYQKSTLN